MPVSAFLITLNEEENLPRCLNSLHGLVDEVVVVDCGSTDETLELAAQGGARVISHPWEGFVGQKNFAMAQCVHDWVFSVDADEEVSPELKASLERVFRALTIPDEGGIFAYAVPRRVWYQDRWIFHGDWYPDYVTRVFYRPTCQFSGGAVHESLTHPGRAQRLAGDLYHYTYKDRADHLARVRKYSALWARGKYDEGKRAGPLSPWLRSSFRFVRSYLLRRGFLDGRRGLEVAAICSYEVWLKYRRLRAAKSATK